MGSSIKTTTMKLLSILLVITLFFATIYSAPMQKANAIDEECEEEAAPADYEPALGVPDLVIDLRENDAAPVVNDEDCEDEIVTEEPEVEMATEECEDYDAATEEPPQTEAAPLVTEECEDEVVTAEPETQAAEVTSECADEEIVEELPEVFEMALPEEDVLVEEECEE